MYKIKEGSRDKLINTLDNRLDWQVLDILIFLKKYDGQEVSSVPKWLSREYYSYIINYNKIIYILLAIDLILLILYQLK